MSRLQGVTFSGCGNTLANLSKRENKSISLLPQARLVPTGVARITELEEQGWTYLRP
jgi:intracellular sulfur oxidation DsrE/DsrF family protein